MKSETTRQVLALTRMSTKQLRAKYLEVFGEETRSCNKQHLLRRIAWRIQANDEGGLSERARRRALEIANDADLRLGRPKGMGDGQLGDLERRCAVSHTSNGRDTRLPNPGTLLVREFKGTDIVVKVLEDGFEYEGEYFKSLSAIAQKATGTKWNGFTFFSRALGTDPQLEVQHA